MTTIESVDGMSCEEAEAVVGKLTDICLWDDSDYKWKIVNDSGDIFLFAGVVWTDQGWYLWLIPTEFFRANPLTAVRSAKHWLHFMMKQYFKDVWCLVALQSQSANRLVELIGFQYTGQLIYGKDSNPYRLYRRN